MVELDGPFERPEVAGVAPRVAATEGHSLRRNLDDLRTGLQIIDADWRYVYVNTAAAGHGKRWPDELVGRTMMEAYPGIETTPLFDALRRCMTQRTPQYFQNLFTFPNGESRWFEIRAEPTSDGLCVLSFDIHERRVQELAAESRLAALDAGGVGLWGRAWRALNRRH